MCCCWHVSTSHRNDSIAVKVWTLLSLIFIISVGKSVDAEKRVGLVSQAKSRALVWIKRPYSINKDCSVSVHRSTLRKSKCSIYQPNLIFHVTSLDSIPVSNFWSVSIASIVPVVSSRSYSLSHSNYTHMSFPIPDQPYAQLTTITKSLVHITWNIPSMTTTTLE